MMHAVWLLAKSAKPTDVEANLVYHLVLLKRDKATSYLKIKLKIRKKTKVF